MNLITSRTLWATSLLLASFASHAGSNGYKMVVIAEDALAAPIQAGALTTAISAATTQQAQDPYARQMNLCVAYSKEGNIDKAKDACHKAVTLVRQSGKRPAELQRELRSYAYSNRGVVRLLSGDNIGALADFQRAHDIEASVISQHNLGKLTAKLNDKTLLIASSNGAAAPE
ncbi:hypothetical protein [Rheinheimera sp.]|uniref:hypothetical protein n=1 Tax=Rheinheimera sp. TaxID=1869214 RepID=UPI0027BB0922|nr:hypothetical protein [Rheinheimera sp.]